MRRYLFATLLFATVSMLTFAVWAQEGQPESTGLDRSILIDASPELMIKGAWQPLLLRETTFDPLQPDDTIPLSVNAGADRCDGATGLSLPGGDSSTLLNMTDGSGDPVLSCTWGSPKSSKGYRTVWYSFVAPHNGRVTIDTINSNYDTVVQVYTGSCGSLTVWACSDDFQGFAAQATFSVSKGVTYYVEVADWQDGPPPGGGTLSLSAIIEPVNSKWTRDSIMSLPRSRHAVVRVGTDFYVVGGQSALSGVPVVERRLERFETKTGQWVRLADKPGVAGYSNTGAAYLDGAADDGRIYLPSGYNGSAITGDHWIYDIKGKYWFKGQSLPWPNNNPIAWSAVAARPDPTPALNGYYVTGGLSTYLPNPSQFVLHRDAFFFSPDSGWQTLPQMQKARHSHMSAIVGGNLCVVGGVTDLGGGSVGPTGSTECYVASQWITKTAALNYPRSEAGSAVGPDGKWYIFGGYGSDGLAVPALEVYDPMTNKWTALDLTFDLGGGSGWPARAWPRGDFIGSTLWSIGGNNDSSETVPMVDKLFVTSHDLMLPMATANATVANASDGTFGTARQLTFNQAQQHDFDKLLDFFDVFYFDQPALGALTVSLSQIPAGNDANLAVYSANKLLWGSSNNPGNLDESVTLTLGAGRYYVMVERASGLPQPGANYRIVVVK